METYSEMMAECGGPVETAVADALIALGQHRDSLDWTYILATTGRVERAYEARYDAAGGQAYSRMPFVMPAADAVRAVREEMRRNPPAAR